MVQKSVDEISQGEDSRRKELKSRDCIDSWREVRLSNRVFERESGAVTGS